jgi:hypothetical protein
VSPDATPPRPVIFTTASGATESSGSRPHITEPFFLRFFPHRSNPSPPCPSRRSAAPGLLPRRRRASTRPRLCSPASLAAPSRSPALLSRAAPATVPVAHHSPRHHQIAAGEPPPAKSRPPGTTVVSPSAALTPCAPEPSLPSAES